MAIAAVRTVGTASVKGGGTTPGLAITAASGAAAGDVVVVFCHLVNIATNATFSIVDSGGNTWRKAVAEFGDTTTGRAVIFTSKLTNPIAAAGTITVTTTEAGTLTLSAGEWSGTDDTTDQANSTSNATGSTSPTVSTTSPTTNANDLVVGMIAEVGPTADSFTAGSGLNVTIPAAGGTTLKISTTAGATSSNSNNNPEWVIVSATGTQTINATITSHPWAAAVLALQATAAVAGAPVGDQWTDLSPRAFEVVRQAGNRIASRAGVLGEWNNILPSLVGKDTFFGGPGKAPDYDWPNPSFVVQTRAANQAARLSQDSTQVHQFLHELDGKDLFRGGFGKAPNWDWPNPSFVVQSRAAYRAAQLSQDQTQVHQFFHGLDGKDALVVGEQSTDLTPKAFTPLARQAAVAGAAQDQLEPGLALGVVVTLPPGESVLDLPPRPVPATDFTHLAWYTYTASAVIQPYQSVGDLPPAHAPRRQPALEPGVQSLALNNTSVALPPGVQSVDLPPRGPARLRDYTWLQTFPLELIGQDAFNAGEQSTDLPPRGPQRSRDYTWLQTFSLDVYAQEPAGASTAATELPPRAALRAREYGQASSFPLELIGQDSLTVGEQSCDLPPRAPQRSRDYSFVATFPPVLIGQDQRNAGAQSADLPPRAAARAREYGQASSFPLELIGQDAFNAGKQFTDLPPRAAPRIQATFEPGVQALALPVPPTNLPYGAQVYDLPTPPAAKRARDYSFTVAFFSGLIGKDQFFRGAGDAPNYDWPNPSFVIQSRAAYQTARLAQASDQVHQFTLELIGKDQRNAGQSSEATALPPRGPARARDYTFTASFPLELIGQDRLNPGRQSVDLPTPARPRHQSPLEPGADALALTVAPEALPCGEQTYELPPAAAPRLQPAFEVGAQSLALGVTVAPTPTPTPAPDFVQPGGKGSRSRPLLTRYKPEQAPRYVSRLLRAPQPVLRARLTIAPAPRLVSAWLSPVRPTLDAQVHVFNQRHVSARLSALPPTLRSCRQIDTGCTTLAVQPRQASLKASLTHTPDETWLLALLLSESREAMRSWQGEATKRLSRLQRELNAQVARTDAQQARLVSAAQPHIRHALNVQRDAILVALPHATKASVDTTILLDDPGYKDALVLLINALEDLQQAGVTLGYTDMTPNNAFDMQNPYVQAATTLLAQRIVGINETTADAIRAAIADGLEQGLTAADMGTVIRDLGAFSDSRALTLAATESRTALNLGNAAAFQEMGATEVLVADGDYDEMCAELDGSTQSLAWYQANPIGHPNCRRTATALPALVPA